MNEPTDILQSVPFLILALGGLMVELLVARRRKEVEDLYIHSLDLARGLALLVLFVGIAGAALSTVLAPLKSLVSEALIALAVVLVLSGSFYGIGTFRNRRYLLLTQSIERMIEPWRRRVVMRALESFAGPVNLEQMQVKLKVIENDIGAPTGDTSVQDALRVEPERVDADKTVPGFRAVFLLMVDVP